MVDPEEATMTRTTRPLHHLLAAAPLAALALLLTGCTVTKSLSFQVLDLESGEPIAGARVLIEQGTGDPPFGPKTTSSTTDERGQTLVSAQNHPFVAATVSAPGYISERLRIFDPHGLARPEPAFVGTVEQIDRRSFEVRLLSGPVSVVTLIVPDGYEGAIDLDYRATDEWEPGQRGFMVRIVDGRIALPAAPALDVAHRFEARRSTGERIPGPIGSWEDSEPLRSQIRLRGPVDGVRVPVYVIGDLERFKRVMSAMYR